MPVQNFAATDGAQNSRTEVAANTMVILSGDLLTRASSGYPRKAGATGEIIGIANNHVTSASDNETVGLLTVSYQKMNDNFYFDYAVSGGTITVVDQGKLYSMLADGTAVDGASESTTVGQLRMVKFISATLCTFEPAFFI